MHNFPPWRSARSAVSGRGSGSAFYLPGKIPISQVAGYRRLPATETGRKILKRFLVRGHWRRPNPSWNDQRLRWIEPYWKGPDLGRVIEKQYLLKP